MRTTCLWAGAVLCFFISAARADEVAPLVPKTVPPKANELVIQFHDALASGLKAGGLPVMSAHAVRTRLKMDLESAACFESDCARRAAALLETKRVATAQISAAEQNYTIEVHLYQGDQLVGKASGRCDICTVSEAVAATKKTATDAAKAPPLPPTVAPTTPPPPPPSSPPPTGSQPGVTPTPPAGEQPTPPPTRAFPPTPSLQAQPTPAKKPWPLWPGIALAGAGVVGIAIGAPLIAIDGNGTNCAGKARSDKTNCADLYTTAAGGWVLTALGIGALAGSAVSFYLYFTTHPKEQRRAGVERFAIVPTSEGGVVLGASGRF